MSRVSCIFGISQVRLSVNNIQFSTNYPAPWLMSHDTAVLASGLNTALAVGRRVQKGPGSSLNVQLNRGVMQISVTMARQAQWKLNC